MAGWTKAWRKELESNIWEMHPLYHRVFVWLRHKVVFSPTQLRNGVVLAPGQYFTTLSNIARGVAWQERGVEKVPNRKTISGILEWLEERQTIVCESNRLGTLITLLNWDTYQEAAGTDGTTERTTKGTTERTTKRTQNKKVEEGTKNKTFLIEVPVHLETPAFKTAWGEWEKHRQELRKKLTPTSTSRQIGFLGKHDEQSAIAIIEQSITNGWAGLFELKGKGGQDAGRTSSSHGKGQGASRFGDYSDDEGRFRRDI